MDNPCQKKRMRKTRRKQRGFFGEELPLDIEKSKEPDIPLPEFFQGWTPLDAWLLYSTKGAECDVILVTHEGTNGRYYPMPIKTLEEYQRMLSENDFPHEIKYLPKRFRIKCVQTEFEED